MLNLINWQENGLKAEFAVFLTHGSVEVDVVVTGGEFESERPDGLRVVDIVGLAEDTPEVGELEVGQLAGDEVSGFGVANKRGGIGVVDKDMIETFEFGREAMIRLDENAVLWADNGKRLSGVFDDGEVAFGVCDEVVLGDGTGDFGEGVDRLASGGTVFGDEADEVWRLKAVVPLVDMGVGETDVETLVVDGVLKIGFAGSFAGVTAPDAFVRKGKIAVRVREIELVGLEKFAGAGEPIIVVANKGLVTFVNGKDCTAVRMRIDAVAL